MKNQKANSNILVFAHRGASKDYPENTLPAFERAAELHVDFIETDVHLTRDWRFAVIHDDSIDRTTNGNGKVMDYTMYELMQFDAGYNFSNDGGITYPYRDKGIRIISLDEMLESFPEQRFNIDLKDRNINQINYFIEIIKKYNGLDRIIVGSKHYSNLKVLRKICPKIPTSFSIPEALWIYFLFKSGLLFLKKRFTGIALQVPQRWERFNIATSAFINEIHKKGIEVHLWTINREKDIRRLIDIGADGIMSDDPELLLKILGR